MTKILPTIGPVTEKLKDLKYLIKYSDYIRLNGAHNNINWHKKISNNLKKLDPQINILLDFPGVKPRTSNNKIVKIKKNEIIIFFYKKSVAQFKNFLNIGITNPFPVFKKSIKEFSVNDGRYKFRIIKIHKKYILAKSDSDFDLSPQKGVNFPLSIYDEKSQLKKYLKFYHNIKNVINFDAIGLSYVQSGKLVKSIKKKINKIIISKIENINGLKNIKEIAEASDAIMIDRGDLSAEIGEMYLYKAIKKISQITSELNKPLIMATENLESMIADNVTTSPTKSEIISLEFSRDLGADRIMLSDETATSNNWKNILKWLDKFLNFKKFFADKLKDKYDIFWSTLSKFEKLPIILFTKKGYAVQKIKNFSYQSLYIFTENKKIKHIYSLKDKVTCRYIKNLRMNDNLFFFNTIKKFKNDIFKNSDIAILINVAGTKKNSRANSLSLVSKKDF